jgi:hypothetical protein
MIAERLRWRPDVTPHAEKEALARRHERLADTVARATGKSRDDVLLEAYLRANGLLRR